jgi:predicted nucleotidyltransferase
MSDFVESGLSDADLTTIRSVFVRNSRIWRAILFGSRAKGTFRRGSDVDIALEGEELSREDIVSISLVLNEETNLPYRFDVVDRNRLENQELAEHIDRVGWKLYQRIP